MVTWSIVYALVTTTFTATRSKMTRGTFRAAVIACISRVTSIVTVTRLFVTWCVVQTVATTVDDTVVTIGPVVTHFDTKRPYPSSITSSVTLTSHVITGRVVSTMS